MGACSSTPNPLTPHPAPVLDETLQTKLLLGIDESEHKKETIDFVVDEIKDLPEFQGEVYQRGQEGYTTAAYQYASSSYSALGVMQPAVIIFAKGDEDVINAINYARSHTIAVAIRTGGHSYCASSSTYGKNLQIDLSETYTEFKWENSDYTQATVGVSWPLKILDAKLAEKGRFVPHAQCNYIHVGGHAQTGGYGMCGRSFGLFSDHIQRLRIIDAEGNIRIVERGVAADADLFFALIGGSPGNFGVLTHVTLTVEKDEDHPHSRGFKGMYFYTPEILEKLLNLLVDMAMELDFPADFDYSITMLSTYESLIPNVPPQIQASLEQMFPESYNLQTPTPPVILVYVQWANLEGPEQQYDSSFIDRIKVAAGPPMPLIGVQVNDDVAVPMSKLVSLWAFDARREYELPYVKRTYMSNSMMLNENGWVKWLVDRVDEMQQDEKSGCKLMLQFQNFGGKYSQFFRKSLDGSTALSWRDSHIACSLDCFHEKTEAAKATAEDWVKGNDQGVGPEGKFCSFDRRMLWGSHDLDLSKVWKHYYDNGAKYERLLAIKQQVDPLGVFSPHAFCVGSTTIFPDLSDAKLTEAQEKYVAEQCADNEQSEKIVAHLNHRLISLSGGLVGVAGHAQFIAAGQHLLGEALNPATGSSKLGVKPEPPIPVPVASPLSQTTLFMSSFP